MQPYIEITTTSDNPITTLSLGNLLLSNTHTFSFRVHNNLSNLPGIGDAKGVKLIVQYETFRRNLLGSKSLKMRCTFSDELQADPSESFQELPLENEDYDVIKDGGYNEYEGEIDFSVLNQDQKDFIKDNNISLNITVKYDLNVTVVSN